MTKTQESGTQAEAHRIIDRIDSELEDVGVTLRGQSPPKQLNWDDPDDRALIRRKFEENAGRRVGEQESILAGFGERGRGGNARGDCGDPHPFLCDSCANAVNFGRTCSQSVCARCGVAWCRDAGIKKTAKLRRVRKEQHRHTPDHEHQKFHHQVISPNAGWYYCLARAGFSMEEAQDLTQSVVKEILDEMRGQGLLVRHSYRGKNEDGSLRSDHDDRGFWQQVLNSGRDFYGDVRDQLAWKPHYHCVVVADRLKTFQDDFTERIEDKTGWVLHRISNDDGISIPNDGAMASVVTYTLSHGDIMVRKDANNRSAVWEVGSFEGDPIRSSGRFSAQPADLDWAESVVQRVAKKTLGLYSATTDCGEDLPAVEDPDQLAKNILEDMYPEDPEGRSRVATDAVLHHLSEGNIEAEVSTLHGGGGNVTVTSTAGQLPNSPDGLTGSAGALPWSTAGVATAVSADGGEEATEPIVDGDDVDEETECTCGENHASGHDHDDDEPEHAEECDGTLIPLEEARRRGLLDDDEWLDSAPNADEAREADREWPDDLDPWRTSSPGEVIGAG